MAESEMPKSEGSSSQTGGAEGLSPRRGSLSTLWEAMKHINQAAVADSVRQRWSDIVSWAIIFACVISLMAAVFMPVPKELKLLPLILTVGAVVFFIINRLGIVLTLTSRQALIVWQILMASFWLGVTSAMLVVFGLFYFFGQTAQ